MKFTILITVFTTSLLLLASSQAQGPEVITRKADQPGFPSDAKSFKGKRYQVYQETPAWDAAQQRCAELGGQLAVVPDKETWEFIRSIIPSGPGTYWLGATDQEKKGDWKWVDSTSVTFSLWFNRNTKSNHEERENRLGIDNYWPGTLWRALPNNGVLGKCHITGFICEWKAGATASSSLTSPDTKPTAVKPALTPAPVITPAASSANTYKADPPQIKILSEESVNVTAWITAPLDVAVPEQIWENLNFLKESLKDERDSTPAASPAAYQLGVRLCLKMLENLAERDTATTRAGGNAVLHQKSNLTQQNRDHLTWPQYALERDERAERKDNARKADRFMSGHSSVEWNNKTTNMRKEMQAMYAQFREAQRQQQPAAK